MLAPVSCPQFGDTGSPSSLKNETTDQFANSTDLTNWLSSDESKSDWIEPAPYFYNPGAIQSQAYDNVFDAFRLLQINPSVQVTLTENPSRFESLMCISISVFLSFILL